MLLIGSRELRIGFFRFWYFSEVIVSEEYFEQEIYGSKLMLMLIDLWRLLNFRADFSMVNEKLFLKNFLNFLQFYLRYGEISFVRDDELFKKV